MITLKENKLNVEEYFYLRNAVGWRELSKAQAKTAIKNSILIVTAFNNDKIVGMGRIVGDGAVICYIQDLIVIPNAQGMGIGKKILSHLKEKAWELKLPDTQLMLGLMCAKGREEFYISQEFIPRPTDNLGPGMIMYLK